MTSTWTADRIPDLTGKVIIVTGANSGIGFEAAVEFARKGATVILGCRPLSKAQEARDRIMSKVPEARAEALELDLADLASVRRFAAEFVDRHTRLDVLANNAGIMMVPFGKTTDGFESQFGINHLGHFALTGLLLERLFETPDSRVVTVSSTAHRMGTMDFDNLMYENGHYSPGRAYGRSKLANLMFTYELQKRFDRAGVGSMAMAAHPGWSHTNLSRHLENRWFSRLMGPLTGRFAQSATMGALPTLRAATDPEAVGGRYYGPDGFMEQAGHPVVVDSNRASHEAEAARQLWDVSEGLTGVSYGGSLS